MPKITFIFGTRPEAIKLAPVIMKCKKHKGFITRVCVTAQHREMLDQVLGVFGIKPDVDLSLMEENQGLADFAAKALVALDRYLKRERPDMIIVQGDTTTTWVASLAGFYNKIRIAHIEAGLRTYNKYAPFPEEINRVLTTHLADLHFAPTKWSARNLMKEGIPKSKIFVTGNTVIDALFIAQKILKQKKPNKPEKLKKLKKPFVLITGHRRENFGEGLRNICHAIKALAKKFPDHYFVYPVHLNPNVRRPVMKMLNGKSNIILTDPVDYLTFVWLMDNCRLILTDSGGIQEEAPSLGKPVFIIRDTSERPEGIESGVAKLVGTDYKIIFKEVSLLLNDQKKSDKPYYNPYGDGRASQRIVKICWKYLKNVK